MTNEEAIKILISDRDYLYTNYRGNDKPCYNEEAYTIAIKALEFVEDNFPKTFEDYLRGET